MRGVLLLLILSWNVVALAQLENSPANYYDPYSKYKIGFDAYYGFNSTAITTRLGTNFLRGDFIDDATKQRVSDRLRELDFLGGDIMVGGHFIVSPDTLFKRTGMSWFGAIHHREHINAAFPPDVFNLAFFGNARYENQEAFLSGLDFNSFKWQQFEVGLMTNRGNTGLSLSFLKGQEHQHFSLPYGRLFTAPDGEYLDLDLAMQARQSTRDRRDFHHVNGGGLSADFFTWFKFGTAETFRHRLLFEVRDLGFIRWDRRSINTSLDTTFRYEGIFIDNLFTLSDSILEPGISDSALVANATRVENRYSTLLPAIIHLAEHFEFHEDFTLVAGLKYRFLANYNIYFYLRGDYKVNPYVDVSLRAAVGGYGIFNAGAAVRVEIKGAYKLVIGTENLEGWILPRQAMGSSAFVGFQRRF